MDPTMPTRPKHWKKFGGVSLLLLVVALATAVGGWAVASGGGDPGLAYRLAALFGAGALLLAIMWAASAGSSSRADDGAP